MFNEIGKFFGWVKEEPTLIEKVTNYIATNWSGMLIGACLVLAIFALVYGIRAAKAKRWSIKTGAKKVMNGMKAKGILALGKIRGKFAKPKAIEEA